MKKVDTSPYLRWLTALRASLSRAGACSLHHSFGVSLLRLRQGEVSTFSMLVGDSGHKLAQKDAILPTVQCAYFGKFRHTKYILGATSRRCQGFLAEALGRSADGVE
jgi:hypothetical protein